MLAEAYMQIYPRLYTQGLRWSAREAVASSDCKARAIHRLMSTPSQLLSTEMGYHHICAMTAAGVRKHQTLPICMCTSDQSHAHARLCMAEPKEVPQALFVCLHTAIME